MKSVSRAEGERNSWKKKNILRESERDRKMRMMGTQKEAASNKSNNHGAI